LCKPLAVTRETKLTLSIALNPIDKLTLERDTNLINRKSVILYHTTKTAKIKKVILAYLAPHRHIVSVLTSNDNFLSFAVLVV